jgi:septum formation protein
MKLILASKSPRRQELIKGLGFDYSICTYDTDESFPESLQAGDIPAYLAQKKAAHYPRVLLQDEILLTADTVVWINGKVLNKPQSEAEAIEMLDQICGNTHEVFTGICLKGNAMEHIFVEQTFVSCSQLSLEEKKFYIQNYNPFDKAGSYGIQDWFGYAAVQKINGCFYNVMGLPVHRLRQEMKALQLI